MATHRSLAARGLATLNWDGDTLVDMAGGGIRYNLDGTTGSLQFMVSFPFDGCVMSGDGRYAILFQRLGTKAVMFDRGTFLRELNRSFYHAAAYDYPVCTWSDKGGRGLIAHCPEEYNRLVVEDIVTGERLMQHGAPEPRDFFHSRLQVNPGGSRILSAGWIWHPLDALSIMDLPENISDPIEFNGENDKLVEFDEDWEVECAAACWQSDDVLIAALHRDEEPESGNAPKSQLVTYDAGRQNINTAVECDHLLGPLMPVGSDRVVSFYGHPRLLDIATGNVVEEWPDIASGRQNSSIADPSLPPSPTMALDPGNNRFAMVDGDAIHVVEL